MPFDDHTSDSLTEFELVLSQISALINSLKLSNQEFVVMGDFNADLRRLNKFDKILREFVGKQALTPLETSQLQVTNFTYMNKQKINGNVSYYTANLDHVLVSSSTNLKITSCNIVHDAANLSDHRDIHLTIANADFNEKPSESKMPSWIDLSLPAISRLFNANIAHGAQHLPADLNSLHIDELYVSITSIIRKAYESTSAQVVQPRSGSKPSQPWWSPELTALKKEQTLLFLESKSTLDPMRHHQILQQLTSLKRQFRRIQRANMKSAQLQENERLSLLAKAKSKSKFWKFLRRKRSRASTDPKISVPIEQMVASYHSTFSPITESESDKREVSNQVQLHLEERPSQLETTFSLLELELAIAMANASETCGFDKTSLKQIKSIEGNDFKLLLLSFFNRMLRDQQFPINFNRSIIRPILKSKEMELDDIGNTRPISVSNALAQILELLILIKSPSLKMMHQNQFGFRAKTSTNHAIFVVKETIANYVNKKTPCKVVTLDAAKAFDRVWRNGLYLKLRPSMDPWIWKMFCKYYETSTACVELNGEVSQPFNISSGVKQGGILSPFLFNLYIDDLLKQCTGASLGALFNNVNVSIIAYADDLVLLSPLDSHLQKLLDICSAYGAKWKISFNPKKSTITEFGTSQATNRAFEIAGQFLDHHSSFKYLGVEINQSCDSSEYIKRAFRKVQKLTFSLQFLGLAPKATSPFFQSFLYRTLCLSKFTYGLETLHINQNLIDQINISQNKLIRSFM